MYYHLSDVLRYVAKLPINNFVIIKIVFKFALVNKKKSYQKDFLR